MLDPGENNENIFACELCMVASACQSTAQGDAVERFDEGHSHRGRPPCFHEDVCDKDLAKLATDAASCRGAGKDCQWDEDEAAAFKAEKTAQYDAEGHPFYASARLWDDGVIKPADSRRVLGLALAAARHNPGGPTKFGVFRM